jgi:hypothetical protein
MAKINWMGELGAALQGVNQALQTYRQQQIQDLLLRLNMEKEARQAKYDQWRMQKEMEEAQSKRQKEAQEEADRQAFAATLSENPEEIANTLGIPVKMVEVLIKSKPSEALNTMTQLAREKMLSERPHYQTVGNTVVRIGPQGQAEQVYVGPSTGDETLNRQIMLKKWEMQNVPETFYNLQTDKLEMTTPADAARRGLVKPMPGIIGQEKKLPPWVSPILDPARGYQAWQLYQQDPDRAAKVFNVREDERPAFDALMDSLSVMYANTSSKGKKQAGNTQPATFQPQGVVTKKMPVNPDDIILQE